MRALRGRRTAADARAAQLLPSSCTGLADRSGSKSLKRSLKFKDFYRTMSFVNALAHIANTEDHHPDLGVGYGYCHVTFSTHAIGGLSRERFHLRGQARSDPV